MEKDTTPTLEWHAFHVEGVTFDVLFFHGPNGWALHPSNLHG
jgi:hypothetical protein